MRTNARVRSLPPTAFYRQELSPQHLHLRVRMHHSVLMGSSELDEVELRHRIEAGIEAADELKRRLIQLEREESRERPKLRLIKGGAIGVVVLAGVEWLRGYRRVAVGMLVTTTAASGLVYLTPNVTDPPTAEIPPPSRHVTEQPRPPTPRATVTPRRPARVAPPTTAKKTSPPRTSPPRTQPSTPAVAVTPTTPPATAIVGEIVATPVPSIAAPIQALPSVPVTPQPDCAVLSLDPLGVCLKILGIE